MAGRQVCRILHIRLLLQNVCKKIVRRGREVYSTAPRERKGLVTLRPRQWFVSHFVCYMLRIISHFPLVQWCSHVGP
jgi:hypothetical protein